MTIDVVCTANSVTTVTETLTNAEIQYIDVSPNVADPLYIVNPFTTDLDAQCPVTSYQISSVNTSAVTAPTDITFTQGDMSARPNVQTIDQVYNFYIAVEAESTAPVTTYFSAMKTLVVGCVLD